MTLGAGVAESFWVGALVGSGGSAGDVMWQMGG